MAREILFRGKQDNKWVYGYFVQALDVENKPIKSFIIKNMSSVPIGGGCVKQDYYEIEFKTLGQYTGLKDKNGTKIFEGDIVECSCDVKKYVVKFDDYRCGWFPFATGDGCGCCETDTIEPVRTTVLGNIYDSPELLESVNA